MANQRMYMACEICMGDDSKSFEESAVYLTKYYPSSGWMDERLIAGVKKFFEQHDHRTMLGKYARIIYDSEFDAFGKERDEVIGIVGEALASSPKGSVQ